MSTSERDHNLLGAVGCATIASIRRPLKSHCISRLQFLPISPLHCAACLGALIPLFFVVQSTLRHNECNRLVSAFGLQNNNGVAARRDVGISCFGTESKMHAQIAHPLKAQSPTPGERT